MSGVYANFEAIEQSLTGSITHTFKSKSRQIILSNDSDTNDLEFKFGTLESYGTLKPTETVTLSLREIRILLRASSAVDYRLWVYG